jgi:hypothetical protein
MQYIRVKFIPQPEQAHNQYSLQSSFSNPDIYITTSHSISVLSSHDIFLCAMKLSPYYFLVFANYAIAARWAIDHSCG